MNKRIATYGVVVVFLAISVVVVVVALLSRQRVIDLQRTSPSENEGRAIATLAYEILKEAFREHSIPDVIGRTNPSGERFMAFETTEILNRGTKLAHPITIIALLTHARPSDETPWYESVQVRDAFSKTVSELATGMHFEYKNDTGAIKSIQCLEYELEICPPPDGQEGMLKIIAVNFQPIVVRITNGSILAATE